MTKEEKIKKLEKELAELKNTQADFSILDKYIGKYLYFEGYESGSVICRIDEFGLDSHGDIIFRGIKINLKSENSDGAGVAITPIEDFENYSFPDNSFEDFPYFENAYDFEEEDDSLEAQIRYLDAWLSYGEYSSCTPKDSRELPPEKVMEVIIDHLKWYLPPSVSGSDDCIYGYE